MIPSQGISQQKFIISGDTIIGYTPNENRKIALLFLDGEHYEKLYFNSNEIISYKDSIIETLYGTIEFKDNIIKIYNTTLDKLNDENINNQEALQQEKIKRKRNAKIATTSGALNIVLIIILCLL